MSTVTVQVGQCGNQVGQSLWKKYMRDEDVTRRFSLVDTFQMYFLFG